MENMVIRACPGISSNNSQALAEEIRAVCQHHHKAEGDATHTGKSGTSEFSRLTRSPSAKANQTLATRQSLSCFGDLS